MWNFRMKADLSEETDTVIGRTNPTPKVPSLSCNEATLPVWHPSLYILTMQCKLSKFVSIGKSKGQTWSSSAVQHMAAYGRDDVLYISPATAQQCDWELSVRDNYVWGKHLCLSVSSFAFIFIELLYETYRIQAFTSHVPNLTPHHMKFEIQGIVAIHM